MEAVSFLNSFLSYALLLVVIVALCAVAGFIGIILRKRKNGGDVSPKQDSQER